MSIFDPLAALKFCENEVKKLDFGCYLHGLLIPEEIRSFYYTIHAFRLELTKSQDQIHSASLLINKKEWWLNNLDSIWANNPIDEPITISINELRKHHMVRKSHFERLIKGNLEENTMKDWRLFEKYIDSNYTMTIYILLELFSFYNETEFQAATYVGRSWGIMKHLLRTEFDISKGKILYPQELLKKHEVPLGIVQENEKNENEVPEKFYDVIFEIAAYGKYNLEKAREMKNDLPKYSHLAFLQMSQAEYFYSRLEAKNFAIFNKKNVKISWPRVLWRMVNCSRKGVF